MQSHRPSISGKFLVYASLYLATALKVLLAVFLYLCALDSKTIALSYGLIVLGAVVFVLAIRRLVIVLSFLRQVGRVVEENMLSSNNQSHKENE